MMAMKELPPPEQTIPRHPYGARECLLCGYVLRAPISRIKGLVRSHLGRCQTSSDAERKRFISTGQWPKAKRAKAPRPPEVSIPRFWERVNRSGGPESCWAFRGSSGAYGHGKFRFMGEAWMAHRLSYYLEHGPFDPELWVLHRCDNPPCVNPRHLYLGTHADNMNDRTKRNRSSRQRGTSNASAKLNDAKVLELRRRSASGEPAYVIARDLGISASTASKILRGEAWTHVAALATQPPDAKEKEGG